VIASIEFTCAECGRRVTQLCGPDDCPYLCGACLLVPGWFRSAECRRLLAPDHDGKEKFER
jgi:hypothetical protein